MGNGNGKIIDLSEKRPHLSTEDLNNRIDSEKDMIIGEQVFIAPQRVLDDPEALKKWNELVEIYKGFDYVSNIDTGAIEKYCIAFSEYCRLMETKEELASKIKNNLKYFHADTELKLDQSINKKHDLLIKMEDRLFLNPASRVKFAAAKANQPKESHLEKLGFGMV